MPVIEMHPNFLPNAHATAEHIKINLNCTKCTYDLAHHMTFRAMELGNPPALQAIRALIAKEKFFLDRLTAFANQITALQHCPSQLRDPQKSLNELQGTLKNFDIEMANFYASGEYQAAFEYLCQVKRAKPVHGKYLQPLPLNYSPGPPPF